MHIHGQKIMGWSIGVSNNDSIQQCFNEKSWYVPEYDPDNFDANMGEILNQYELKNAETIKEREKEIQDS